MPSCTCGRRGTHAPSCPVNQPVTSNHPSIYVCSCKLPCQCKDHVAVGEGLCRFCRTGRHIYADQNGRMQRQPTPARQTHQQFQNSQPRQGNPQQRHQAPHPAPKPNTGRLVPCPVCKRNNRNPSQAYCPNCTKKLNGRPAQKLHGECKYGRCHDPVAKGFLGLPQDYCPPHLRQHQRGLI